jgi:hypothetical protein
MDMNGKDMTCSSSTPGIGGSIKDANNCKIDRTVNSNLFVMDRNFLQIRFQKKKNVTNEPPKMMGIP